MNLIGFSASAIGNHEFDRGKADLQSIVSLAKFQYLADNIVDASTGQPASFTKPYIIVKAGGIDVGIIGVGNPETPGVTKPEATQGLRFLEPVAVTNNYVKELVGKGVKTIIVVYHQGATNGDFDNQTGPLAALAKGLDPEVDLLIGGHNRIDTLTRINGVLTHEANNALTTGDFTLLVDPQTKDVAYSWGRFLRPSGGAITPDPDLAALVKQASDAIKPTLGERVGESAVLVDRSRGAESKMGNLVSDAIRATYQVDVALQNSGGLRADFQPGPLTRADVFAVLPFGNLVVTGQLKGSDLLAALENGVSDVSGSAGRFIQLSGVRFAYDASQPVGKRVLWAVLSDGKPVDPNATYKVAANDFMTAGGDGYASLTKMIGAVSREPLFDVAANYVKGLGKVNPQVEGRIIAAQPGQPAPTPPTLATPALPTPVGALPTAAPAQSTPVSTPTAAPAQSTTAPAQPTATTGAQAQPTSALPGVPHTGAGDSSNWLSLAVLLALLALGAGLLLVRRRTLR
jgi:LPXTG-motif cell wall-anchored protein